MIGKTIREFEILSELGSGGYGVVYRARDKNVERDVAIKMILPQYASQPKFIENFTAEARLVAKLEHKDIVPLYSYWHDETGAFLVMRYVRGGSLRDVLRKRGGLPVDEVLQLIRQISDALQVAHGQGVIHRDLKPDNILLDEQGNAYLTDFGIAKRLSDQDVSTATDALKGTFAYMSPEQIRQDDVSPQTDVYALGILLYELLTGVHPYSDFSIGMLILCHLQRPFPSLLDQNPDLDETLDDLIQKATAKELSERYQDTRSLVDDLEKAIKGKLTITKPPVKKVLPQPEISTQDRNRRAMLQNVRKFWVEGVLEQSLHNATMLDLGLKAETGAVDSPWDTLLRTPLGDEVLTDDYISAVFDRMNGKLLVLGDPGSGKTTTLLMLARDLLVRAEQDEQQPIPVILNLSSWGEHGGNLFDWIIDELNAKYQVPRKIGLAWLEADELLLLLDGLDEVGLEAREACVAAINAYRDDHGFVDMVVCSRVKDYETLTTQLKLSAAIIIQPLDEEKIQAYLEEFEGDTALLRELVHSDPQLREIAQTPLMLSIMILVYHGKTLNDIPDLYDVEAQRQHLFEAYVQTMFERRTGGDVPFSKERTVHYLSWLASAMQSTAQAQFQIEELEPALIPGKERQAYYRGIRAFHTVTVAIVWSIQFSLVALAFELPFIAWTITAGVIGGIAIGWIFAGDEWRNFWSHIPYGIIQALGLFLALFISTGTITVQSVLASVLWSVGATLFSLIGAQIYEAVGGNRDTIPLLETVNFDWRNIRPVQWVLIAITPAIMVGGIVLVMTSLLDLQAIRVGIGWVLASAFLSLVVVFFCGLDFGQVSSREVPNQGVYVTLRTASSISLVGTSSTTAAGMALALILGIPVFKGFLLGAGFGIGLLGYAVWTVLGGMTVVRHFTLRRILSQRDDLPLNVVTLLDYAASLILMRKVGGGYIFIHRYLMEYFADIRSKSTE